MNQRFVMMIGTVISIGLCVIYIKSRPFNILAEDVRTNIFLGKTTAEITEIFDHEMAAIKKSPDSSSLKASAYADLGEMALEAPRACELSMHAFDESLLSDGSNAKANFYSALLLPVLKVKGAAVRLVKIVTPEVVSEQTYKLLNGINEPDAKKVVSDLLNDTRGEKIFRTPEDVQVFLTTQLLPVIEESQRRLQIVAKDSLFELTFDTHLWHASKAVENDKPRRVLFKLNQVEVHAAQVALKGVATLVKIAAAYHLDAALAIRDQYQGKPNVTTKIIMDAIRKYPQMLTLREGGADLLKSIFRDAQESIEGLKVISNLVRGISNRNQFYIVGSFRNSNNLEEVENQHYDEFMTGLKCATDLLAGPVEIGISGHQWEYHNNRMVELKTETKKVLFNGSVLFSAPLADLKSVMVDLDEKSERVVSALDPTFGGAIPNGDLISTWHSFGNTPSGMEYYKEIDFLVNYKKEKKEGQAK